MRKKYIGILLILLIIINIFTLIFVYNSCFISRESKTLLNNYKELYNYLNTHESFSSGTIEVIANYRGAHGENYPNFFNFDYINEDNTVTFTNSSGSLKYSYDNEISNIINILKNMSSSELEKIIKYKNNKVLIDKDKLNELTKQNFKNVEVRFNYHGLVRKLDNIEITLDGLNMIIKDKVIEITYNNNVIKITLNSSGYSLNINDILKMNAFLNEYKNTYSIIIKDKVFHVEYSNEELVIKALSEGAIYNGLDLHVKNKENVNINNDSILTNDDVPIIRYYNNIDIEFWRK